MRYMDKYLGELLNLHLDSFCLNLDQRPRLGSYHLMSSKPSPIELSKLCA